MQQFGTSMLHTVVRWHKLEEVESECTFHNFIVFAIFMPKIIKFGENVTKLWWNNVNCFFSETQYKLPKFCMFDFKAQGWIIIRIIIKSYSMI